LKYHRKNGESFLRLPDAKTLTRGLTNHLLYQLSYASSSDKGPHIAAPRKRGQIYGNGCGGATGIGQRLARVGAVFWEPGEGFSIGSVYVGKGYGTNQASF
jgi:hypothetical protein